MAPRDRAHQRSQSSASYFATPLPTPPHTGGKPNYVEEFAAEPHSQQVPRLTDQEAAEMIEEGELIRKRVQRHRVDIDYVLQCNTMLLEWVAMREKLLRHWHSVPAQLVPPSPAATPSPAPSPPSAQSPTPTARSRQTSFSTMPTLSGRLLQLKRSRSVKEKGPEPSSRSNGLVAGITKRMSSMSAIKQQRRRECSCSCTCGAAANSLKFDDDAVVVMDLHAELIKYDELLRSLKERLDGGTLAATADDDESDDEGSILDTDYEADQESIVSSVAEVALTSRPPPRRLANSRYPWRIPEANEAEAYAEDAEGSDATHDTFGRDQDNDDDASSVHTVTHQSSAPTSPTTPNMAVIDNAHHMATMTSQGSSSTVGVLSTLMQLDARSILGSEYTGGTFGMRSYASSIGDVGPLYRAAPRSESYRNLGHTEADFGAMLDRLFVINKPLPEIELNKTQEERERALGGGAAARAQWMSQNMRGRQVSEFGVRMRQHALPTTPPPYPSPVMGSDCHKLPTPATPPPTAVLPLPPLGNSIHDDRGSSHTLAGPVLGQRHSFHSMEQFADAPSSGSSQR